MPQRLRTRLRYERTFSYFSFSLMRPPWSHLRNGYGGCEQSALHSLRPFEHFLLRRVTGKCGEPVRHSSLFRWNVATRFVSVKKRSVRQPGNCSVTARARWTAVTSKSSE